MNDVMKIAFWVALAIVAYTYIGYAAWLYLRSLWRSRPVHKAAILPTVSIIVAAHNEEKYLPRKLKNLCTRIDYPADKMQIIVVSDGSTDATDKILADCKDSRLTVIKVPTREGKAAALNRAVPLATGEVLVFTDARQLMEVLALRQMVMNFADPTVGCVSGQLFLGSEDGVIAGPDGEHFKWSIENKIRELEGKTGSVVGALGAFYAVRRELRVEFPKGTILDDCYLPISIVRKGQRVVFEAEARVWDDISFDFRREFRRKVRTLTGNYQLLLMSPWLLGFSNPLLFEFVSHKLLRLLAPFALLLLFVASIVVPGPVYSAALLLQCLIYGLAVVGTLVPRRGVVTAIPEVALTFVVLNAAAAMALVNFITQKDEVWARG